MNINSVNPLYFRITHANGYIEEKEQQMKIKNYLKKIMMFLIELEIKSQK